MPELEIYEGLKKIKYWEAIFLKCHFVVNALISNPRVWFLILHQALVRWWLGKCLSDTSETGKLVYQGRTKISSGLHQYQPKA